MLTFTNAAKNITHRRRYQNRICELTRSGFTIQAGPLSHERPTTQVLCRVRTQARKTAETRCICRLTLTHLIIQCKVEPNEALKWNAIKMGLSDCTFRPFPARGWGTPGNDSKCILPGASTRMIICPTAAQLTAVSLVDEFPWRSGGRGAPVPDERNAGHFTTRPLFLFP